MKFWAAAVVASGLWFGAGIGHAATEPASWPARTVSPEQTAQLYLLIFADRDIAEVSGQVLGVILQTPFEIDPAVKGSMSLVVEERLTRAQLLARYEASLARSGVMIARPNGRLRLVPRPRGPSASSAAALSGRRGEEAVSPAVLDGRSQNPIRPGASPQADGSYPWMLSTAVFGLAAAALALAVFTRRGRFSIGAIAPEPPPHGPAARQAVLEHLCAAIEIDPTALALAKISASRSGRPVEHALNGMGIVSDEALVAAYAAVTGLPVWRPDEQPPLASVIEFGLVREGLVGRGLAPVRCDAARLTLATSDPLDDETLARVALESARTVSILIGAPSHVRRIPA